MKLRALLVNVAVPAAITGMLLLLVEGGSSLLLSVRAAKHTLRMQEESHARHDPDLGWSHRPGVRITGLYGEGTQFSTNAQGFRGLEDFPRAIPPGRYRLVALGDSFTMGYGVGDDETYPAQMQALCPGLQTVNMGQGGYGVDQDYLWYKRDGVRLDANVLLFAVIAHDFYRMSSDTFIGYGKPVLRVREGALRVENQPVPSWTFRTALRRAETFAQALAVTRLARFIAGRAAAPPDSFYGEVGDEVFAAAALAFDDLARRSAERGQRFVLVYLPSSDLLAREPTREAAWLEAYSRGSGVPFVNLVAEFNRLSPSELARLYRPDYHYTREGNRLVAQALLRQLPGLVPGFPPCQPIAAGPASRAP